MLRNKARPISEQLDYLEHQFKRHLAAGTLHRAAIRSAAWHAQDAARLRRACRQIIPTLGDATSGADRARRVRGPRGSLINYMDNVGLLGPRLKSFTASGSSREIDRMAAADAGIVLNQLSNFKLKSAGLAAASALSDLDLILIDLNDVSYLPYNSAAGQLVDTELAARADAVKPGPSIGRDDHLGAGTKIHFCLISVDNGHNGSGDPKACSPEMCVKIW